MLKCFYFVIAAISEFISEFGVESTKSFEARWERILACTGATTDSSLARILSILPQSVTAARKRQQIPSGWVEAISEKFDVSADWLFFGRGPMRPGDPVPTAQDSTPAPYTAPDAPVAAQESACAACAELKKELDMERRERRELTAENRQLWKDNASLREENATLRERQYRVGVKHGDAEALGGAG